MDDKDFIEELRSFVESPKYESEDEFVNKAKELLLKAHALIKSFKEAIENKDSLIKKYTEEKKTLIERLNLSVQSERKAYERLADIDISRHVEVADLKREIELLKTKGMKPDDKTLNKLKQELKGSEDNLRTVSERLRELESKYKNLMEEGEKLTDEKERFLVERNELYPKLIKAEEENMRLLSLEAELKSLNDALSEKDKLIIELKEGVELLNQERSRYLEKLSEAANEALGYHSQIERIKAELNSMKEALKAKSEESDELSMKLSSAKREIDSLKVVLKAEEKKGSFLTPKRIAVILLILLAVVSAIYVIERFVRGPQHFNRNAEKSIPLKKPFKMPSFAGFREVRDRDFTATLTFLSPEMTNTLSITEEERSENYFYVLELNAQKGCIPDEIIDAPLEKISFINQDKTVLRLNKINGLEAGKKVIYNLKRCSSGAVFFRYYLSISTTYNPKGIILEGLIKDFPLIID